MASYLHGVHVPHRKKTRHKPVLRMEIPQTITIPMAMHIGAPASPIVKIGDEVKVGQKIAEAGGFVSVPIFSGVSGKVTKMKEYLNHDGKKVPAIVIESDGLQTVADTVAPPTVTNRDELLAALKESGIVGLGGAGFPTHVKFAVEPERIHYLIINGAECEPYVTSDTMTMMERSEDMDIGFELILGGMHNAWHTSSLVAKTEVLASPPDYYNIASEHGFGDFPYGLMVRNAGPVRYLNRTMSVYRLNSNQGAWSAGFYHVAQKRIHFLEGMVKMLEAFRHHVKDAQTAALVDESIDDALFLKYNAEGNAKMLLQPRFKKIFAQRPLSFRMKIYLNYALPGLQKLYRKLKGYES